MKGAIENCQATKETTKVDSINATTLQHQIPDINSNGAAQSPEQIEVGNTHWNVLKNYGQKVA